MHHRWDGEPRDNQNIGIVGRGGHEVTYQHTRDESGPDCPDQIPTTHHKPMCVNKVGQQHSGLIHKQTGRHEIAEPLPTLHRDPRMVCEIQHNSKSMPHTGKGQLHSRFFVPRQLSPDRVAITQKCSEENIPHNRETTNRPICVNTESSATDILCKTPGSISVRNRRILNPMGKDIGLRFSPIRDNNESAGEGDIRQGNHSSNRTILASEAMVHTPNQPTNTQSEDTPSEEGFVETARDKNVFPRSSETEPDTLAHFRQLAQKAGLSERAANLAAKFLRTSTRDTYDSRLHRFYKWCREIQTDPTSAPVGKIADFLILLFDEGLSLSTIRGYRSAIAAIHVGFENGETISNSIYLSRLMKAFFLEKPPIRTLLPKWDLPRVLRSLTKAPFEPMHKCSLLNLSVKTTFLLAVASGARRSLIHALSIEPGHIRWEKNGVRMIPRAGFIAKNQKEGSKPCEIVIPSISAFSSISEDRLWCPVRALKWYISRTKDIRKSTQLFVSSTSPYGPVSSDTISRWIVQGIRAGGTKAISSGSVKAHDTRGVAASWALFQGVALEEILQAAYWASPNTFIAHYLKDVINRGTSFGSAVLTCPNHK